MSGYVLTWITLLTIILVVPAHCDTKYAKANLTSNNGTQWGVLIFTQKGKGPPVRIQGILDLGFQPGKHGFHVHSWRDFGEGDNACNKSWEHFNPHDRDHGPPDDLSNRHVGDLGNIEFNASGVANVDITDNLITVDDGTDSILGKSLTIHEGTDDLGKGGNNESRIFGNAGVRLNCGLVKRTTAADPHVKHFISKALSTHYTGVIFKNLLFSFLHFQF